MLRRLLTLCVAAAALALPASAQAGPFAWSGAANIDGTTALTGISCPSPSLCVAMDSAATSNALVSNNPTGGAGTWSADPIGAAAFQTITAVSCPSTTLCVAVDSAGFVYWSTDPAGSVWSNTVASVNGGNTLQAISCPTTTLCVAAGLNNVVWATVPTGGAGSWTQTAADATHEMESISCPTTTLCVAGDDVGNIVWSVTPTGLAATWTADPVSTQLIGAISCPSTNLCVAGDDNGDVWTSPNPTGGVLQWTSANITANFMNDISCAPGTTTCVAFNSSARAFDTINPTGGAPAWTTTILTSSMAAASCPTALLCAGAGNSGNAFFGTQGLLTVALAGSGSGSVSGPSIACSPTCGSLYPGGTIVNLSATPATGSTFAGWSGDCTGTGTCTVTMSASRNVTATFDPNSSAVVSQAPVTDTPAPSGPTPLPPPVVAQSANAIPVQPGVLVKPPGTATFVPLTTPEQLQFGAIIDARKGRVRLVIANGKGGTDSADFYQGIFRITQRRAAVPIAELTLVGSSFRNCSRVRRASAARAKGKSVRHLWGSGSGAFRTKGRYASATIRGTRWLTDDRCNGTLVRAARGSVTVRDLPRRKSLVLRAPKSYFAAS